MLVRDVAPEDLVDADGACVELGGTEKPINRTTLYRGVQTGRYPKPIKIGAQAVRWLRPELRAFRNRAIAARNS